MTDLPMSDQTIPESEFRNLIARRARGLLRAAAYMIDQPPPTARAMTRPLVGRLLTEEAFKSALRCGIEKMVARMTLDQGGAIAVFTELGFHQEALLAGHVKDLEGNTHDLVMMTHRVEDFQQGLVPVDDDGDRLEEE